VFSEVTALGIPTVVTSGCAFAQPAFAQGRAMPIESYDSEGVTRAVLCALDQHAFLAESAQREALAVSGANSLRSILEQLTASIRDGRK
jgi:hypothetical protein